MQKLNLSPMLSTVNCFFYLFITECSSFYLLNHERKLFSVIGMSKKPSQLHNMVFKSGATVAGEDIIHVK
jgi:hypothetical protein